jgi:hypothetical protein
MLTKNTSNSAWALTNVTATGAGNIYTTDAVGIGTTAPTAGYLLDVSKAGGSGIRITDTTNVSSLRLNFAGSTGTISSARDDAFATTTVFQTQTSGGSTTNTLSLSSGSTGGVCDIFTEFTGTSDAKILRLNFGASVFNRKIIFGCRTGGYNFIQGTQSASETQYRDLCLQPDGGAIIIGGPTTGPSPATTESLLNTYINSSAGGALTTLAEFRNVDFTALTRSFIRVRQGATAGSSYSSYFGTGQDGNCYIIANDSSRGGDIIISPTSGNVGIGTAPTAFAALKVAGTGILSTTGINVSGNGGFYNAPNKFGVDVNGAATRFYASGPDVTTPGNYEFHIISSNGTPDNIAMRIANTGLVTIASTITPPGAILDVSSGRSFFSANSEKFAIGARYSASVGAGAVYFGATNATNTPDVQISAAGGGALMTLKNSGVIQFNTGYGAGALTSDATGNITSVSDERLKTIDGNFTAGLNEVLQIKPILYHWNESSQLDTENMYAGFSAQNIQSVIPIATMAQKDTGYLSLQDRPIIAALVNSIKELEARIKILELK